MVKGKIDILHTITSAVHQSFDLNYIYDTALDLVLTLKDVDMAFIYIVSKDRKEAILEAHRNLTEDYLKKASRIPCHKGITWKLINSGQVINVDDIQKDETIGTAGKEIGHRRGLGIPIKLDGVVMGTTIEDLEPHVEGKVDPFNILFDFLSPASYADSVRGSNCGGSTYPAGTCSSATFFDDDSSDGRTPGFELCVDYNAFACYFDSILDHLKKNLADPNSSVCESHSSNSDCSYVECMNQHNNPTFMKAPVGLEIEIYFDGGDLINDIVGDCGGTISTICGCAFGGGDVNDDPLRSVDAEFKMNGQHSCSWVELIRHEVAHTYGYRHVPGQQDYDNNRDDLKHCVKNRHRVH